MINSLDIFIESNWIKIYPIVGILILVFTKNIVGTRVVKLLIILVFTVFCLYYGGMYWGGNSDCGILCSQCFLEWHTWKRQIQIE